ncbi:MAG: twin-arginine translocase TatA/TatE family subunit [Planctomycetota bacterium]|nr:twin-arginine translocase TatA/TatE family subunit [Planctomycetota bacterium]
MFGLNHWELLIILAIALLLFGRKLPDVGRSLGKGIIEFKKGLKGVTDEIDEASRADVERPNPYRAPLAESGEDRRVSREDVVVEAPKPAQNA